MFFWATAIFLSFTACSFSDSIKLYSETVLTLDHIVSSKVVFPIRTPVSLAPLRSAPNIEVVSNAQKEKSAPVKSELSNRVHASVAKSNKSFCEGLIRRVALEKSTFDNSAEIKVAPFRFAPVKLDPVSLAS